MNARLILDVLDRCVSNFSFPTLDNGYVYPAAARLALYRAPATGPLSDWAIVIEEFAFSPRAEHPYTMISTAASRLHNRRTEKNFVNAVAYQNYLANNGSNESHTVFSVDFQNAQDPDYLELLSEGAAFVDVRGRPVAIPTLDVFARYDIALAEEPRIQVFELCRYLAATEREHVLATSDEQRFNVPPELERILQLDEWHNPDPRVDELPSHLETFRQLADVLISGDVSKYRPSELPNTHWRNWPLAGTL